MSLLSTFSRQSQTTPDHFALIEGDRRISYSQLHRNAAKLSCALTQRPAQCQRVAIFMDRGIDAACAIIAVLGIGACYIPLDVKNPAERLNFIINDADPQCVIGKGPCPNWLEKSQLWLDIDQTSGQTPPDWPKEADAEALAAILYTSGSTGAPKGVALSHRAMSNFADWAADTFAIHPNDHIASLAPFHFDLSVFDLFSGLGSGATIHFVPASLTLSPSRLTTWLSQQRITVFYTVPSLLGFIALKGSLSTTPLPDLRTLLFAGEIFPTPTLKTLCQLLPAVDFYNLYGPTETNVCCYWPVAREQLHDDQPIPIGYPACGAILKIDAESGELSVQSTNNLSGYWQQAKLIEALTADRFYRTGDKVSLNEKGEYCYHGRLDRMLKCSGYRVEPAEIETILMQSPGVLGCAVVGIKDSTSGNRPAAAIVLQPGAKLDTVIKTARQKLPPYMQPAKLIVVDSLPYLANGKTDYREIQRQLEIG